MGPARKVQLYFALFLALTCLAIYWAVSRAGIDLSGLVEVLDLGVWDVVVLLVLTALLYGADLLRYRALGRAVGVPISYRAALEASIANFFFSWLTPGAAFGAPATIFMLHRHKVPWDAAAIIAFGKSLTGVAIFVGAALCFWLLGWAPDLDEGVMAVVVPGLVLLSVALGALLISALFADAACRSLARCRERLLAGRSRESRIVSAAHAVFSHLDSAIERLGKMRHAGVGPILWIACTHLAYFAVFSSIAVFLAIRLGAISYTGAVGASTSFLTFSYLVPTPGGAGSEALAVNFFGGLMAPSAAVAVVLVFRAATFYLQILLGFFYLLAIGVLGDILKKDDQE